MPRNKVDFGQKGLSQEAVSDLSINMQGTQLHEANRKTDFIKICSK